MLCVLLSLSFYICHVFLLHSGRNWRFVFVPVNRRLPLSETVNRFLSLVVNDS